MNKSKLTVISNYTLTESVYRMDLSGDVSGVINPGQFVNIKIEGLYLRRPISVCDLRDNILTLIYKVVGRGTHEMSRMRYGEEVDVLCGLGNGYDLSHAGDAPLLIGGGVGVPPLYYLSRKLISEGKRVKVILGFNTSHEIFFENEFRELGCDVIVVTVDGSAGIKGFVTEAITPGYSYFYTCGPEPMLKAVYEKTVTSGQFSFEERMGCGFGACMGCTCKTVTGYKRICRDGPVLEKEEILW